MGLVECRKLKFEEVSLIVEPVQGYYYAIATISQSLYRRDDIISLLQQIANHLKQNMPKDISVLKRNMDVLKKNYPDLERVIF